MKMNKTRLFALTALALVCVGCHKDEEPQGEAYDTPYSRMKDPEYRKKIDESLDERKALMTEASQIAAELEAEMAKDPSSPKVAELEAAREKVSQKILQQRMKASALVRERIEQEQQAIKAREEKENLKKGNN